MFLNMLVLSVCHEWLNPNAVLKIMQLEKRLYVFTLFRTFLKKNQTLKTVFFVGFIKATLRNILPNQKYLISLINYKKKNVFL